MPTTTNYGWTIPTVGGNVGTWGTVLNTLFGDIDSVVKGIEDRLDVLDGGGGGGPSSYVLVQAAEMQHYDSGNLGALGAPLRYVRAMGALQWVGDSVNGYTSGAAMAPLGRLRPGQVISEFISYGSLDSGTCTVKLCYITPSTGVETVVSTGHTLPSSLAATSTSGLSHTVLDDKFYYIRFDWSGAGAGSVSIIGAKVIF